MSLTTKHTFALSRICAYTKEKTASFPSSKKLSGSVLFIFLFLLSQYTFSQNPIAGNQGFQILSEGSFTSTNTHHIHGSLAVGGNLVINSSSLGEVNMDNTGSYVFTGDGSTPTGLLVKGSVTWTAGTMKVGDGNYIHIGNSTGSISSNNGGTGLTQVLPTGTSYNNAKRIEGSVIQPTNVFQTVGFDFTTLFNNYRSTSTTLSTKTNNVQLYNTSNVAISGNTVASAQSVRINTLNTGVNYLNLTASSLTNITELVFNDQPSISKVLIINVPITANYAWNNVNMTSLSGAANGAYILWNFYGATTYNLTVNQASLVIGTVYAPNMNLLKAGTGDIDGNLIAKTVQLGTGEIHNYQFASDLTTSTSTCTNTNASLENGIFSSFTTTNANINGTLTTYGGSQAVFLSSDPGGATIADKPITGFSANTGYWVDATTNGGLGAKDANRLFVIPSGTGANKCVFPNSGMGFTYTNNNCYRVCVWVAQFNPSSPNNASLTTQYNFEYDDAWGTVDPGTTSNYSITPTSISESGASNVISWTLPASTTVKTITGAVYTGAAGQVVDWKTLNWQQICFNFTPAIDASRLTIYNSTASTNNGLAVDGFCISSSCATCSNVTAGGTVGSNQSFCASGNPAAFTSSVAASGGSGTISYQWEKSVDGGTNWADIVGATSATYDEPNTIPITTHYRRKAKSSTCTTFGATSNTIIVTITPLNITATSNSPVCTNSTIHFETQSTTSGITYSWTGPNGFTSTNEQYPCINNAQAINGGTYTAMVTLNGCTATATVNVVVNSTVAPPAPTVPSVYKCAAGTATFTASNCAGTVNWFSADWDYLGSGTTFTTSSVSQNTQYLVECQTATCLSEKGNAYVIFQTAPTPTISASNSTICAGQSVTLTASSNCTSVSPNLLVNSGFENTSISPWWTSAGTVTHVGNNARTGTYAMSVIGNDVGFGTTFTNLQPNTAYTLTGYMKASTAGQNGYLQVANYSGGSGWIQSTVTSVGTTYTQFTLTFTTGASDTSIDLGMWRYGSGTIYVDDLSLTKNTSTCTYSWSPGGATTSAITVSPTASTTYSVTAGLNGCTSTASATINITVISNNSATASSNSPVTVGGTINLTSTGVGTYAWSGPASFASTLQNPSRTSATTAMAGVYTVTVTNSGCTASATTNVVVNSGFSCSGSCESANLVVNPQFETDMSGWIASNGQLTRGGGGTYGSFLEVNVGDLTGTYAAYQDVTFGANAPYKFTAYAAKHGVNNLPKMYLEFFNGTTFLSKTADILVTKNYDGTFQLINFEGNTPANTTKIRMVGWTQNNALKFDNVSLVGCQACFSIVPPASICVGQSATLTANNCSGTVTWNTGATGSTISVNPTTTTTYTATCSNTTNVLSNPSFETGNLTSWNNWNYTTITSTASEKYSGTYGAKITASSAGGGFAQDNVAVAGESYTMKVWGKVSSTTPWSGVGVKFLNSSWTSLADVSTEINATSFQEFTVTNTAPAGTAWVQVYAWTDASTILYLDNFSLVKTSANTTATATVTVNTAPTATATGDTECVGATITLGSTGGSSGTPPAYSWTGPASFASTLQNPTRASATTAMAGVYTVTVTSANGCTATATANVIINNGTIPTAIVVNTGCTGATGSISVTNLPDGYSTNINGGAWTQYKNSYVDLAAGTYSIGYQGGGCNTYANFTVATSTDNPLLSLVKTDPTCTTTGSVTVTGSGGTTGLGDATYQLWYGITGSLVSNLTSNANYPNTPSFSTLVGITEGYNNAMDNIGGKLSGYIVPPTTGTYYFWVASDDYSEFWGSGDANPANKVLLASVAGYTGYREWNKYTSQKTAAVNLTAGQIYYFEVLYKEGNGGDNISLGWAKPGEATTVPSEVIPGKYLRPNIASSTTTPVYQYKIGGGAFQTGNVFTGLAAGTYTVTIQDAGGCTTTASITLTTTGSITAPTGTGASRCGTGTVMLSASGCTGIYNWYAAAAGGTSLGTGAAYTTPSISAATTYYVDCTVSSCVSSRTAVTATITAIPSAPTGTGASRCGTGTVTLSASGCAGAYNWYAAPTGGTSLGSAATYTTPSISATTTYYVDCTVSGCVGSRASAIATINAQPVNPAGAGSRCGTGTVVLTGTGCSGTYNWYAASTGGTSLGSSATYTTPSISTTTTYYLSCTVGSCTSSIVPAVATVTAIPTATASSNSPIVVGGTLNLFSTGGTTYSWIGPNGFTSNQKDVSSANLVALDAGTYTVTVNTGGCTATATTQVILNNYDPGDIDCSLVSSLNFSSPTLISGTAGANNAQYRFSNVAAGTDAIVTILSRSHTDVEIVDLDIPAASYGGYDAAFQPMIDYNWINGGGSFDAAGEKSITFKFDFVQTGTTTPKSIPNLLATGLDIDGSTNEVREFIQASNYQSYQIQTPSSLTLSGALKAKGQLATYVGINELALDAMVSYSYINSSSITVTYGGDWNGSTADFGDTAPGNSDEKRLNSLYFKCYNFNTTVCALPLATPTGTSATRCGTGAVTLSATGCTGTYYWYVASTGGTALAAGSTFTTPSLSATTNYFVECNAVGCTSSRIAVTAFVKPSVAITKVLGDSECLGNTIDLSVTSTGGSGFTYSWSGPSSFISTLQNPTRSAATAAMAGTYSITVTNSDACTATATTSVTVSTLPTASIAGTTSICNGSSTTLTASGGNYYIWGNGSTSAAITVNPAATTSYSVTVYQNNITNTSLITNVTSFNASNFSLINATNSFGGPETLFDGVDNFNAETFHASRTTAGADWGVAYNLGGSVLVTNLSVDRRNDCCTDRGEGGVMQVWRNGSMVYQSDVLNNTGDGVLAATPAPNVIGTEVRYVFLAGANTLSGESTLNFTEFIIGGTKLCQATSTATVTVNPMPTSPTSAGGSRCGTGTVTLSASGCAGTYNWFNVASGGTTLGSASTYTTPSILATTTYYVACTVGSCTSLRTSSVATVNATVTATASSNAPVCVGSAINLSATGGASYLWSGPNSFTSTAQNPSLVASATTSGVYTVTVTGAGGCTATATTNVANPNITISNIVVSACINQPLQDVATVSMSIAWVNAPSGDKIKVVINNKTEYIDVAAGATSPQTVTFIVPANGIANIPISASWVTYQSGNCNTLASFNAPVACSVDNLNCEKILYLCGPDKPADGDAWDHGFMNYLTGQGAILTATYTKPDASGYGLYNPLSITTLMSINLNDYTSIIISPTTEANLAPNLLAALKGYSGGILMMNYTESDDLGLISSGAAYSWQDNAYTNNTNSIKIYNYDNINPTYGNVVTHGNYLATADTYLWAGANNMSSATNGVYFYYTPTDAMAGVPATHGARVYLGYHMNGVYSNSQNGGAMPAPSSSYFSPTNHLTLEGKAYFDQAIKNITTGLSVQATGDTECAGSTINLTSTGVGIVSYSWTGPSSFTSTLQNPTRSSTTTAMSGIYTVTVTGAGGCTATATANVVVNAIPAAPTSAGASRCSTGTVTMTASGCAGGTISWYGALTGGTALTTGATYITPSISATTTYYLECSLNGCVSTTRNTAIATVNGIPTPTANATGACVGGTIALSATGGSGTPPVNYSWSGPSAFSSSLQNPTRSSATTAMTGYYVVTVTSASGCTATANTYVQVSTISASVGNVLCNNNATLSTPTDDYFTFLLTPSGSLGGRFTVSAVQAGSAISLTLSDGSATGSLSYAYPIPLRVPTGKAGAGNVTLTLTDVQNPSCSFNVVVTDPGTCNADNCTGTTQTVSYSYRIPLNTTELTQTPINLPKFDNAGGTKILTKVDLKYGMNEVTTAIVENQAASSSNLDIAITGSESIQLGVTTLKSLPINYTNSTTLPAQIIVPAQGNYVGDSAYVVFGSTKYSTLYRMNNWLSKVVDDIYSNPSADSRWVTNAAGNATYDDDIYIMPVQTFSFYDSTTYTTPTDLTQFVGTGNIGLTASTDNNANFTGGGGNFIYLQRTKAYAYATVTYSYVCCIAPTAVSASSNSPICSGQNITLTASSTGGSSYSWAGPSGFTSTLQNPTITGATTARSGIYTVTIVGVGTCTATATVNVVVNAIPTAPTSAGASRCGTGTVTMTASGCAGGTISWYGALTGGTALTTGATYITPSITATTTYYLGCSLNGCISTTRNTAVATVNSIPTATATGDTECVGSTISLASSGGSTYLWSGPSSFTSTLQNPTRSSVTTAMAGVYTVTVTSAAGCSATATANVVVNVIPTAPTSAGTSRCGTGTVTMTASGCAGGTISWYGGLTGGTALTTGVTYTTPSISATTTYYLECSLNGCVSTTRNSAVATVNSIPTATATANSPIIGGTLNLYATGGNTYSWTGPNGFSSTLKDVSTAPVTASMAGVYSVTVSVSSCTATATTNVSLLTTDPGEINCSLIPTLSFTSPILITGTAGAVNAQYRFSNVTGGTDAIVTIMSKSHPDIDIIDIDIPATTYGGYEAAMQPIIDYNWINGGGSFDAAGEKSVTFKIDFVETGTSIPKVMPNFIASGIDIDGSGLEVREFIESSGHQSHEIQTPTSLTLSGGLKAKGAYATYAGINELALDAVISYGYVGKSSITVTYGAEWNGSSSDFVDNTNPTMSDERRLNSLYFKCYDLNTTVCDLPLTAPTGVPASRCGVGTVTLSATGCSGTYNWYAAATGGTAIGTSNSYITPSISANTTYYVECNAVGCTSTRTSVLATVNAIPAAPTVSSNSICGSGSITLTATGCTGGTISWFTSKTGGTSLGTGTTYTASALTSSAVYFAACTNSSSCVSTTRNYGVATVNSIPEATLTGIGSLCLGYQSTNSGKLLVTKFKSTDTFSYNIGATYNSGTASAFTAIPTNGEILTGISDPSTSIVYTVRIKNAENCTIDKTVTLTNQCSVCPAGYCEPSVVVKTK